MLRFMIVALILAIGVAAFTCEPASPSPRVALTRIECHGKLRQGEMAIGGETTGASISFDGIIWELKLPDEAARKFAKEHHKQPVTVEGSLRRVTGTERSVRWIVDVTRLVKRNAAVVKDGATMTVQGSLQHDSTAKGPEPQLVIVADGLTWPLDMSQNQHELAKAKQLTKQMVLITGKVGRVAGHELPPKIKIELEKIEPVTTTTARRR